MIKYFYELTEEEFGKECVKNMTYKELADKYPQPIWCSYPNATEGLMGCWSLMNFMVKNKKYCKDCECFKEPL